MRTPAKQFFHEVYPLSRCMIVLACIALFAACTSTPVRDVPSTGRESISIMTWNIHFDTPSTEQKQLDAKLELIRSSGAELVLLQEVLTIEELQVREPARFRQLLRAKGTEYGIVTAEGASRVSGSNLILYDRTRFVPLKQGIYWFSESPLRPDSTSYGNIIPRFFIWAEFYDVNQSRRFTVVNTHLSRGDSPAKESSITQLFDFLDSCEGKVVIGGDFNSLPNSSVYKRLAASHTDVAKGKGATLNAVPLRIDYIFTSPEVIVRYAEVLQAEGLSDHRPVYCELEW